MEWSQDVIRAAAQWQQEEEKRRQRELWREAFRQQQWHLAEPTSIMAEHLLYHGNWDGWFPHMKEELQDRGLFVRVRYPHNLHVALSEEQKQSRHDEETVAVNLMMARMDPVLRHRIPCDHQTSAHEFFELTRLMSRPFRFFDLPRELRDDIYKRLLVKKPRRYKDFRTKRWLNYTPAVIAYYEYCNSPEADPVPALLQASHRLRQEAAEVYYKYNSFRIFVNVIDKSWGGLDKVIEWRDVFGMDVLRHLRKLEVCVYFRKDCESTIEVSFTDGLRAEVDKVERDANIQQARKDSADESRETNEEIATLMEENIAKQREREQAYCTKIDQQRKDEQWDSTGVIEYFVTDPDALRRAMWSPPKTKEIWDGDEYLGRAPCNEEEDDDKDPSCWPW